MTDRVTFHGRSSRRVWFDEMPKGGKFEALIDRTAPTITDRLAAHTTMSDGTVFEWVPQRGKWRRRT